MKEIGRRTILHGLKALGLLLMALPAACTKALANRLPTRTVEIRNFEFDPATGMVRWQDTRRERGIMPEAKEKPQDAQNERKDFT